MQAVLNVPCLRVSLSPCLLVSSSPRLLVSSSPRLLVSSSPGLLVQRQVSGEVQVQHQTSFVNPVALMMAAVGMGVSLYSSRRLAERVQLKPSEN